MERYFDEMWIPLNTIRRQLENFHRDDERTRLLIVHREAHLLLQICERAQTDDLKKD